MSDVRALEERHDALSHELDALVRSNQNRRGVLIVESTKVHVAPILIAFAIAGLLGAAFGFVWTPGWTRKPPPPTDCR
jgi:hypothetical protein